MNIGWGPLLFAVVVSGLSACVPDTDCANACSDDERCVDGACVDDASEEGEGEGEGTWGEICDDVTPCAGDLVCGQVSSTCAEPCASADDCDVCAGVTNGACTCNEFGFCQAP